MGRPPQDSGREKQSRDQQAAGTGGRPNNQQGYACEEPLLRIASVLEHILQEIKLKPEPVNMMDDSTRLQDSSVLVDLAQANNTLSGTNATLVEEAKNKDKEIEERNKVISELSGTLRNSLPELQEKLSSLQSIQSGGTEASESHFHNILQDVIELAKRIAENPTVNQLIMNDHSNKVIAGRDLT